MHIPTIFSSIFINTFRIRHQTDQTWKLLLKLDPSKVPLLIHLYQKTAQYLSKHTVNVLTLSLKAKKVKTNFLRRSMILFTNLSRMKNFTIRSRTFWRVIQSLLTKKHRVLWWSKLNKTEYRFKIYLSKRCK